MYNEGFWVRVWCFFVLGAPALSVLPLLVFLVIVGDIKEETLAGVCSTLVIVPIVAVSILVCCCSYLKVPAVGHFSLKNIKQSLCKKIKRENTKKLSLNKKRNTTLHTFKLFSVIYIFFWCTISAGANTVNTVNNDHCSLSPNLILKYPNLSIIILGIKSKETTILYILYILIC